MTEKRVPDEDKHTLDDLLQLEDSAPEGTMKKIRRGIAAGIYGRIIKFILVLVISCAAVYLLVSAAVYGISYNPQKAESFSLAEENGPLGEFGLLMQTFDGLFLPDYFVHVRTYETPKKTGLGKYEIPAAFGTSEDGYVGKNTGVLRLDGTGMQLVSFSGATYPVISYPLPFTNGLPAERLIEDVEELPDSAYLDVSITFANGRSIKDMYAFMEKYARNSVFTYLTTFYDKNEIPLGLDTQPIAGFGLNDDFNEKYPNFYYEPYGVDAAVGDADLENDSHGTVDADAVRECYQSRIRLLLDNPEFLDTAFSLLGNTTAQLQALEERLRAELEKSTEEILFLGCRGRIKKADLLDIMSTHEDAVFRVHRARFSNFPE